MVTKKTAISGAKALLFIPTTLAVMALVSFTTRNTEPLSETFSPPPISNDSLIVIDGVPTNKKKVPLLIFDGQKIAPVDGKNFNPDLIGSMTVLKGDAAIAKYGPKGCNGVIEISAKSSVFNDPIVEKGKEPLVICDGNKITFAEFRTLDPSQFGNMTILKGEQAVARHGRAGRYGVVEIISKPLLGVAPQLPLFRGQPSVRKISLWCAENLTYPSSAYADKIEGIVFIDFIIEVDGTISEVEVAQSSGHSVLDDAALELVRSVPSKWTAAMDENGNIVRSPMRVPIRFRLK